MYSEKNLFHIFLFPSLFHIIIMSWVKYIIFHPLEYMSLCRFNYSLFSLLLQLYLFLSVYIFKLPQVVEANQL